MGFFDFMSGADVAVPQAPTTNDQINSWMNVLPRIYGMQTQFMPQMAQQQKSIMEQLYPQTAGLQENLAGQATQGMQSSVPTWMQDQWQSNMNAQLGSNAGSPIGADYMSRGLMQQQQDWKQYYQQMAMSLAGRQPLASPSLDYMSNFNPSQVMSSMNQNYGTQAGLYGPQVAQQQNNPMLNMIGGILGSAAGAATGGMTGYGGMFGKSGG